MYPALADVKPAPHPLLCPLGNSETGRDVKVSKANVPAFKTTNLTPRTCSRRSSKVVCSPSKKVADALSGQRRRGNHKGLCQPTPSRSERTLVDFWPSNIRQQAAPRSIVSTPQTANPTRTTLSPICSSAIPTPSPTPVCSQKDCSERVPTAGSVAMDSKSMCIMINNVADVTKQENVELQLSPGISFACRTSLQEFLPPRRRIPASGLKLWVPGTTGLLYPRPIGAAPAHIRLRSFPVWKIHPCCRQDCPICILRCSRHMGKQKAELFGLVKIYCAFADVFIFVEHLMVLSPTRCFYKLIREGRLCKALILKLTGACCRLSKGATIRETSHF